MHNMADKPTTLCVVVHIHNKALPIVSRPGCPLISLKYRMPGAAGKRAKIWRSMATLVGHQSNYRAGEGRESRNIARGLLILGAAV
jgi:hypothetical protein